MKTFFLIELLILVYACNNKPNLKNATSDFENNHEEYFEISCEDLFNNKKIIGLSKVASNVEYIQLETSNDCLLSRDASYFFTDSLIFISNRDHILKFSRNGEFLKKIGNPGKGPGEIYRIVTTSIMPEKKLLVIQDRGSNRLKFFSFNGDLVNEISIPYIQYLKVLNDGKFIAYEDGSFGREKYTFRLTNELGDTISTIDNYNTWESTSNVSLHMRFSPFEPFYCSGNINFFKDLYNDTVYIVNSNKIEPAYYINLGKYKLPTELRAERLGPAQIQIFNEKTNLYYYVNVCEAANQVFIAALSYGEADPQYLQFSKRNLKGNFLINKNGKSTGFINDWDGGVDFWPMSNLNDNQIFMPINVMTFQKVLNESRINDESIKFPHKYKQLKDMISGLDVSSNPVIMVVTLKSDKLLY